MPKTTPAARLARIIGGIFQWICREPYGVPNYRLSSPFLMALLTNDWFYSGNRNHWLARMLGKSQEIDALSALAPVFFPIRASTFPTEKLNLLILLSFFCYSIPAWFLLEVFNGFLFSPKAVTSSAKDYTVRWFRNVHFCLPPSAGRQALRLRGIFQKGECLVLS